MSIYQDDLYRSLYLCMSSLMFLCHYFPLDSVTASGSDAEQGTLQQQQQQVVDQNTVAGDVSQNNTKQNTKTTKKTAKTAKGAGAVAQGANEVLTVNGQPAQAIGQNIQSVDGQGQIVDNQIQMATSQVQMSTGQVTGDQAQLLNGQLVQQGMNDGQVVQIVNSGKLWERRKNENPSIKNGPYLGPTSNNDLVLMKLNFQVQWLVLTVQL